MLTLNWDSALVVSERPYLCWLTPSQFSVCLQERNDNAISCGHILEKQFFSQKNAQFLYFAKSSEWPENRQLHVWLGVNYDSSAELMEVCLKSSERLCAEFWSLIIICPHIYCPGSLAVIKKNSGRGLDATSCLCSRRLLSTWYLSLLLLKVFETYPFLCTQFMAENNVPLIWGRFTTCSFLTFDVSTEPTCSYFVSLHQFFCEVLW